MPFYAVRKGKKPGVYEKWNDCQQQTIGFTGAQFKKFETREEAESWISSGPGKSAGKPATKPAADKKRGKKEESSEESESDASEDVSDSGSGSNEDEGSPTPQTKKQKVTNAPKGKTGKGDSSTGGGDNVFVDGCSFNIGSKPVAGVGIFWGESSKDNLSENLTIPGKITLNRALIHAAVRAVKQIKQLGKKNVTVNMDNGNLIQGMTSWVTKWQKNGWKTNSGTDVANKEDYEELAKAAEGLDVHWNLVDKEDKQLKQADRMANEGARKS